jgi:predicted glutamine amidotransferase
VRKMCRLFGLIANKPVDMDYSLHNAERKPFKKYIEGNHDGWGIGWYEGETSKIFKQAFEGKDIEKYNFNYGKQDTPISKIFISHVRHGTNGGIAENNSHPFSYSKYIFAHNGGVKRDHILNHLTPKYKNEIKGLTDSECYFLLIMQNLEKDKEDMIQAIRDTIQIVKEAKYSGLNFLLSDSTNFYAYRDCAHSQEYYSLYYTFRNPDANLGPIQLASEETNMMMHSKCLNGEKAVIICSERLTNEQWENWEPIGIGELLAIDSKLHIKKIKLN